MRFIMLIADRIYKQRTLTPGNHHIYTSSTWQKVTSASAWWEPGMSTKLPSSTPKERASGLHLLILKCVNTSFCIILGAYGMQFQYSTGWRRGKKDGMISDLRLTLDQQVEPSEIQSVVASFAEKEPKKIFGSGFKIAGEKYLTIKAEDRSVYGKKVYL